MLEFWTNFFVAVVAFVAVIGPAVFIHELGHFIFAKRYGVKVHTFSVGFGKKLFAWKRGDTEYCISAIPLGGYVKMAGEDPSEPREGSQDEFTAKPVRERAMIIIAGPVANIILGFVLSVGIFMSGLESAAFIPKVGFINDESPARDVLQVGDEILEVEGQPIELWHEFDKVISEHPEQPVSVKIRRNGEIRQVEVVPRRHDVPDTAHWLTRLEWKIMRNITGSGVLGVGAWIDPIVGAVKVASPAAAAGFKAGDRIVSVGDTPVVQWMDFAHAARGSNGKPLKVKVARHGETLAFVVAPAKQYQQNLDGTVTSYYAVGISALTKPVPRGLAESVVSASFWTVKMGRMILVTLKALLTGKLSFKLLAGPVGIAHGSGTSLREGGIGQLIYYLAIISVNLGIVNLFPLPLLDGGWLFIFLLYESIARKSMSVRMQERLMQAGFALIIALILVITYNDLKRIVGEQSVEEIMEEQEAK